MAPRCLDPPQDSLQGSWGPLGSRIMRGGQAASRGWGAPIGRRRRETQASPWSVRGLAPPVPPSGPTLVTLATASTTSRGPAAGVWTHPLAERQQPGAIPSSPHARGLLPIFLVKTSFPKFYTHCCRIQFTTGTLLRKPPVGLEHRAEAGNRSPSPSFCSRALVLASRAGSETVSAVRPASRCRCRGGSRPELCSCVCC